MITDDIIGVENDIVYKNEKKKIKTRETFDVRGVITG